MIIERINENSFKVVLDEQEVVQLKSITEDKSLTETEVLAMALTRPFLDASHRSQGGET